MQVVNITKNNYHLIESLLRGYEYNDFRRYAGVSADGLYRYMKYAFFELLGNRGSRTICLTQRGKAVGVASVSVLKWDSGIFGLPMAGINYIIARGAYTHSVLIKERLLAELMRICQENKVTHLSCRLDTEDISSAHVLEKFSFRIMDVLVTLAYAKLKSRQPRIRSIYKIRNVRKNDVPRLTEIAATSFKNDRFHLDYNLDENKADQLYVQWIENSYRKKERIFVATDAKDNPVGFLTYKINRNFQTATGLKVMGQGLMAVAKMAKGALISLMKATFAEVNRYYDYVEYDTRLNNLQVLRVCNYFNLKIVRTKYTFHKSLN